MGKGGAGEGWFGEGGWGRVMRGWGIIGERGDILLVLRTSRMRMLLCPRSEVPRGPPVVERYRRSEFKRAPFQEYGVSRIFVRARYNYINDIY